MKRTIFTLFVLFFISYSGPAQIITTIAGNGTGGDTGDGGLAVLAEIMDPSGVATDNYGNIYVSFNSRIRKINSSGIISTIAGTGVPGFSGDGGPAVNAQVHDPWGIAVDNAGNLYFADSKNNRIRRIDDLGIITTIAGNGDTANIGDGGAATLASINTPGFLAFSGAGELFLTCRYCVRKIDGSGTIATIAGTGVSGYSGDGGSATSAQITSSGLAIDAAGNIYISDSYSMVVRKVNPAGIISTVAGNGIGGFGGDGGPATTAELIDPNGLSTDAVGNLFICDGANGRIRMVNALGIITTVAGGGTCVSGVGDGGPATGGCLARPSDVKIDNLGNLYIADNVNARVRMVADVEAVSKAEVDGQLVNVYPNPSQGELTLKVNSSQDKVDIAIFDIFGKVITETTFDTNKEVSLRLNCSAGVYFLSATTSTEKWSRKIVIRP